MEILYSFKTHLQGRGLSKRTVNSYITTLRRFARWVEQVHGEFDAAAITSLDVANYRRHLVEKGRKPATINHALDVLNSFFVWANVKGVIQVNPSASIKRVQEQKNAPRWLDRRELGIFIRTIQKYGKTRDIALVLLLIHTGLRISEAVSLKIDDVIIRERSGIVRVRHGKGDKYREVPLNLTVRRALDGYISETKGEWLFPGRRGGHITTRSAENVLTKYGRVSGLNVTPHILRHTFGKMLVDAGESLDRVAALMGHANLNTTARYTRPSVQDLEKAVDRLAWE
ncbi:tyrosine-type recombinase/integrase [Desulfoscipio geothermicus]|uniref:Integrase/recombinase XerC n=1 Tax=Desulfoscipio geothermicus DSM 3669 TaxID=1121426 RepID=A0A1I6DP21_9FIRM|nr:tyrosine-type recombinase/integrase [Desulfoscipio geothermicus]SFR07117.1 integrase/recombinase XerC [Desulfoscipio geothermicus DSM 3669]